MNWTTIIVVLVIGYLLGVFFRQPAQLVGIA